MTRDALSESDKKTVMDGLINACDAGDGLKDGMILCSNIPLAWLSARKPSTPMVCAHTACPDAAERQIVLRDVHDRSIDGDIAGRGTAQHLAPLFTVATEVAERQWPRTSWGG